LNPQFWNAKIRFFYVNNQTIGFFFKKLLKYFFLQ
jgi:hypothetical protein